MLAERLLYIPSHGVCLLAAVLLDGIFAAVTGSGAGGGEVGNETGAGSTSSTSSGAAAAVVAATLPKKSKRGKKSSAGTGSAGGGGGSSGSSKGDWTSARGILFAATIVFVCSVVSNKTRARSLDWNSQGRLYKTAVDMLPGNCRMHHNYATTLETGKEREFHLREAVRLWPQYSVRVPLFFKKMVFLGDT